MTFRIRDALEQDAEQIAALEAALFSFPHSREQILSSLADGRHELAAAVSGDRVLGYAGFSFVLDEGYIDNVAVAPESRRHGIADALMAELDRRAGERRLSFLTLEVRESNAPAVGLYEKNGFQVQSVLKNYYAKPAENAIIMTKFYERGNND